VLYCLRQSRESGFTVYDTAAQIIAAFLIAYVVDMRLDPRDESAAHPLLYGGIATVGLMICLGPAQPWMVATWTATPDLWLARNGTTLSSFVYWLVATLAVLLLLRISGTFPPRTSRVGRYADPGAPGGVSA
jgi:hypothetical protein